VGGGWHFASRVSSLVFHSYWTSCWSSLGNQLCLGTATLKWSNFANCEDLGVSHYHAAAGKGWYSGIGGNPPG